MKTLIASMLITLSLGALASEKETFDSCAHYRNNQNKLEQELNILHHEASKLDAEGNYYPGSAADANCEDVMDEATYISQRISNVRKQLAEVRKLVKQYCNSGRVYPE